jgi:dipeptidyl aminopeptidase/acylaminoacyl peptidase
MMRLGVLALLLLGPVLTATSPSTRAQGTRADYERAARWREVAANKVLRQSVRPHWFAQNSRFWYRAELAGGAFEFILVETDKGERRAAFDHARLASALIQATGRECRADRLPLDRLEFSDDGASLSFALAGQRWQCDLSSYALHELSGHDPLATGLRAELTPRPSTRTGAETFITFRNLTEVDVDLFWMTPEGQRRRYGTVEPGESRRQHTFAGHVWLVTDRNGKNLGVFEATDDEGDAVIGLSVPVQAEPEKPPRRQASSGLQSPDGRWRVIVQDHNLCLTNLQACHLVALTTDGTAEDAYTDRIHWAPDSMKFVGFKTATGQGRKVYLIESSPADQLQPKLHSYDYDKPGDRIAISIPHLFDVEGQGEIPLEDALWSNPWSISELRWAPDSRRFTFLYNQRGHQVLRLVAVDAATGSAQAIVEERSPTFIDYSGKYFCRHLDETREVLWMSERDGWNHLYLYDAAEGLVKGQITQGPWVVRGVERVDEPARQVWFRAAGIRAEQDPYYVHLCRVNFDGTGLVVLTEGDGTHTVEFSPDRRCFLDTWSRVDHPPVIELRRAADGIRLGELERADASALLQTGWRAPERFAAKGRDGQTDIYGVICRPSNFDPARKYPVIEQIYAGPQSAHVPKSFRPFYEMQALAELGFVVVQVDGMGTSHRSKAFHDVCWKNLKDAGFPDRIAWMQAAAASRPEMDLSRVGIYGGSAGGQNALGALLFHGDFYQVAVADCGCHDNRMDKIWWNEQWMGWPVGPEYADNSNVTHAHKLQGKLLLIVGELDRNVDPASTLQVVHALEKADKDFDLLIMTGTGHGAAETPYASRRRQDFFVRHLLGVEPRSQ